MTECTLRRDRVASPQQLAASLPCTSSTPAVRVIAETQFGTPRLWSVNGCDRSLLVAQRYSGEVLVLDEEVSLDFESEFSRRSRMSCPVIDLMLHRLESTGWDEVEWKPKVSMDGWFPPWEAPEHPMTREAIERVLFHPRPLGADYSVDVVIVPEQFHIRWIKDSTSSVLCGRVTASDGSQALYSCFEYRRSRSKRLPLYLCQAEPSPPPTPLPLGAAAPAGR